MPTPASAAEMKGRVLELLAGVAPDVDIQAVRPELEFREQFDFDSMDVFNFAAALHADFGFDIPERIIASSSASIAASPILGNSSQAGPCS
jgi:acyl carrier protein